jgi:hypothetical protein
MRLDDVAGWLLGAAGLAVSANWLIGRTTRKLRAIRAHAELHGLLPAGPMKDRLAARIEHELRRYLIERENPVLRGILNTLYLEMAAIASFGGAVVGLASWQLIADPPDWAGWVTWVCVVLLVLELLGMRFSMRRFERELKRIGEPWTQDLTTPPPRESPNQQPAIP